MPVLKGRKKNQVMTPAIHVPDNYQPPIYGKDETTQAWIRGCLATNKIFKGLLPSDHQMLCDAFKACSFAPGETIIRQGDAGENFYLVESGECDISARASRPARVPSSPALGDDPNRRVCLSSPSAANGR